MIMQIKIKDDGSALSLPNHEAKDKFDAFLKKYKGLRVNIEPMVPESKDQRGFYHGAVLTLWAYLDEKNYKSPTVIQMYHEVAKIEFNGEYVDVGSKMVRIGKSTKGELNKGYLERIIDFLVEQYGINPTIALNPETYKNFRDTIYGDGKHDTFIDYMKEMNYI